MRKEKLLKLKLDYKTNLVITKLIKFLIGNIEQFDKRLSDEAIEEKIKDLIQKTYKNNLELITKKKVDTESAYYQELKEECDFLIEHFLPKQLTEEELKVIIVNIIEDSQGSVKLPDIMKNLGMSYKGQYNGQLAKELILEILKSYE